MINCDSQSTVYLTKNNVFHKRTKHVDVRLHFIRDIIASGRVEIKKIATEVNPANILTKVIPVEKLRQALSLLSLKAE